MIGPVRTTGVAKPQGVKPNFAGIAPGIKPEPATRSAAAELAAPGAPVDTSRVAQLRSAIAQGTYPIDAQAIADAMIAADTTR